MLLEKPTQAHKVLKMFQEHPNQWLNGQIFLRELYLSQYHARIFELQNKRDRYRYEGEIVAGGKNEHGFKDYMLKI